MRAINLSDLKSLHSMGHPMCPDFLMNPDSTPWADMDSASFENTFLSLKQALPEPPELGRQLELFLIFHLLKEGERTPRWASRLIRQHIALESHFPSMSWERLTGGVWTVFPVAMVKGERRKLRHFMAGLLAGPPAHELLPPWAACLLDDAARKALAAAARAASAMHPLPEDAFLYTFPLAQPNGECQFKGSSFGLAASLAFLKVSTGRKTSKRYLATGSLREKGAVGAVEGLAGKLALAKEEGDFNLFIYPDENGTMTGEPDLDLFPVANLDEAWGGVLRHASGNGADLLLFSRMMKDPAAFVAGMARVDASWIRYEADRGHFADISRGFASQPILFAGYVENIGRKLDAWALDDAELFLSLIAPEDLEAASRSAPLAAFRFHTHQIALSNHRGDTATAQAWAKKTEGLFHTAMRGDLNLCADFINNRFVTSHNRYEFNPHFREDFSRILETLERRHEAACTGGCPTDPVLGRLYGTIAQNFAFCGPDYLSDTQRYAHKAMAAFGGGDIPEMRPEMIRQYSYLTYACLDDGDYPRARKHLLAFIGADDWQTVMEKCRSGRLSIWHHAALARLVADTHETADGDEYLRWAIGEKPCFAQGGHPLQLWAFNMGRMAIHHEPYAAKRWFQRSLDLCLEERKRPTIYCMALLPLAGLWHVGATGAAAASRLLSEISRVAERLNPEHFRMLSSAGTGDLLEDVWMHPEKLFPFTYR